MSTSVATMRRHGVSVFADYLEMSKPRIVLLELVVATVAAVVAMPHGLDVSVVVHALAGTAMVAASASIGNSWWERTTDAIMERTANRPLPVGRVSAREAMILSAALLVTGVVWLVCFVNGLTAALGIASWIIYVAIYTPLKTRTSINTAVGAVAGALPLLMGWTATGSPLSLTAFALAGVLFLWQFPHFMAIAWLYRRDYKRAGHRMLPVVDRLGYATGGQAVVGALFVIPVSLVPVTVHTTGSPLIYFVWALLLGLVQFGVAVRFALHRDDSSARLLLRTTLWYMPVWLAVLLVVSM